MLTDINVTGSSIWIRDLHWILTFPLVFVELGLISGVSIQDLVIMVSPGIGNSHENYAYNPARPREEEEENQEAFDLDQQQRFSISTLVKIIFRL
jgi:hypothetical protein